ncbi:acyltransferase family protein [Enterococcus termitis]|uniref:acyltransferase family protein n=1 Tax=Enterococcus termitis TaxID=332950 RepID=UPI0009103B5F|nr:acyltransferase [Enterococcus termitis]OJG97055.1 hypothetical protein RV18_GL001204 [Enterococcus termitis]
MCPIEQRSNKQANANSGIDLIKYIAAILVICFHCERVFQEPELNFIFKNVLCRIAVPYFLISTSYFVRRGQQKSSGYTQRYVKSLLKSYLFWSLIYLPVGFLWIQQNYSLTPITYPVALFAGFFYTGTYYHLWYIPAAIFAIIVVQWLIKKVGYPILFGIAGLMYSFGSLETYYAYIKNEQVKHFFDQYIRIFITTRNGLFFALIFVAMGFFIWDYREKFASYQKYSGKLVVLAALLLLGEGLVVYKNSGIDKNFMFSLIPLVLVLFWWSLTIAVNKAVDVRRLRELGKYYFFLHPLCIVWAKSLIKSYDFLSHSWVQLAIVLVMTHILSSLIISLIEYPPTGYVDVWQRIKFTRFSLPVLNE